MDVSHNDGGSDRCDQAVLVESMSARASFRTEKLGFIPLALGVVLLTAAALKAHELATEPVFEKDLWSSRWLLIGVVELELALGVWLLSGFQPALGRFVAMMAFSAFSFVTLSQALDGKASCGCFGKVAVNPWYTFIFDLAAVTALFWWRPAATTGGLTVSRVATVLALFLIVGVPVGIKMATFHPTGLTADGELTGNGNVVLLEPEKWVGQTFPLPKQIVIGGEELMQGRWAVVLFRHDCAACRAEVPQYGEIAQRLAHDPGAPRVALLQVPPLGQADFLTAPVVSPCWVGALRPQVDWFVTTPEVIFLADGVVRPASEGEAWLRPYRPKSNGGKDGGQQQP